MFINMCKCIFLYTMEVQKTKYTDLVIQFVYYDCCSLADNLDDIF